jgi:hypothetical protein
MPAARPGAETIKDGIAIALRGSSAAGALICVGRPHGGEGCVAKVRDGPWMTPQHLTLIVRNEEEVGDAFLSGLGRERRARRVERGTGVERPQRWGSRPGPQYA